MTLALIQCRLGSRRFPRKALADLLGKPLIAWVVEAVKQVQGIDRIVLAVPPADSLVFGSLGLGIDVVAPLVPEEDVLARFAAVADQCRLKDDAIVVRVTADCPCLDPEAVALTITRLHSDAWPWDETFAVSEHPASGWPDGAGAEAFYARDLHDAAREATWPRDREHPCLWMHRHHVPLVVENPHGDFGHLKLSVDQPSDLTAVREYLQAESGAHPG